MQKKIITTGFLLLFSTTLILAQSKFTISGTVKEKSSGETLSGVNISAAEKPRVVATTNEYGFYSLSLPKGNYTLRFSFVGCKQEFVAVILDSNITASINLAEESAMQEVVVTGKKK